MSDPSSKTTTKNTEWPPTTIEGVARVLHENDRTQGEATGDWIGSSWDDLSEETQFKFMADAGEYVRTGVFVLGFGWREEADD